MRCLINTNPRAVSDIYEAPILAGCGMACLCCGLPIDGEALCARCYAVLVGRFDVKREHDAVTDAAADDDERAAARFDCFGFDRFGGAS